MLGNSDVQFQQFNKLEQENFHIQKEMLLISLRIIGTYVGEKAMVEGQILKCYFVQSHL